MLFNREQHCKPQTRSLNIKLLITELLPHNSQRSIRKLISPFLGNIPHLQPKFGIFHTAIIVGPFILEWTENSLCVPKRVGIATALLTADVCEFQKTKDRSVLDKLAKLIVQWNIEKEYCSFRLTGKHENEGNCQDFVEAIMKTLGVSFTPQGPLKHCIDEMRSKGVCDLTYRPSPVVQSKYGLKEVYSFKTHTELDEFGKHLISCDLMFKVDHKSDWELLKAFDRAFWVRNLKEPDNPNYCSSVKEGPDSQKTACPFGDPMTTGTFVLH